MSWRGSPCYVVTVAALLLGAAFCPSVSGDIFPENDYANFAEEGDFDASIPSPGSVLGYRIGARPAQHHEIFRFFRALAEASPRAKYETYAHSHEGRELGVLFIGSAENISKLGDIQGALDRISDPRTLSDGERNRLLKETPAVCWMAYTIHGNELSGSDAALALAYRLVAGNGPDEASIRDSLIVIIDPLQNPDGRDRFVTQMRSFNGKIPNPDTQSLNHEGIWPWGRSNHYFFDLNRDWFALVHPESRGRVALMSAWNPQLAVDGHGMGSFDTYLFSPPRAPFNPYMTPELLQWWDRFAEGQAAAFDRYGWSYYTREWNEEWFPGYGSTWSIYTGAVGILYEQANTEGTVIKRPDGTTLNFGEAVDHQYVSSLANLITAAENRYALLRDFADVKKRSLDLGRRGNVKEFLFPPGADPGRTRRLMETLQMQGVEVQIATGSVEGRDLHDPWGESPPSGTLPAGTCRVSLDQPNARLARVLLDFHQQMPDSFLVEERDYLERQKGSRLYEITGWSMALAQGVPVYWSGQASSGSFQPLESVAPAEGVFDNSRADYGFVFDGASDAALFAAAKLAAEEYVVRVALEEFSVEGHDYSRGSFLLRNNANPEDLPERLRELSGELGLNIRGVSTALVTNGPDLGGNRFRALVQPKIAMLATSPASMGSMGSLWYLLDHEMELRVSLLKTSQFRDSDLSKYNVLVLPSAWRGAAAWRRELGETGVEKLRAWVEDGGTLIGVGSAAAFLADTTVALSAVRQRREVIAEYPIPDWGLGRAAAEKMGRFQAAGIKPEKPAAGDAANGAEAVSAPQVQAVEGYGIPGPASPVLGAGAIPFAGEAGKGGPWKPPAAVVPSDITPEEWPSVDERLRRFRPRGVFFSVDIDTDDWLTGGLPAKIPVLYSSSYAYVAKDPVRTVARFAEPSKLHLGGLLWPEGAARLSLTAGATREGLGRGQLVLLMAEPYFRAYVHSSKRLFLNAAILGPGLGTAQTVPW